MLLAYRFTTRTRPTPGLLGLDPRSLSDMRRDRAAWAHSDVVMMRNGGCGGWESYRPLVKCCLVGGQTPSALHQLHCCAYLHCLRIYGHRRFLCFCISNRACPSGFDLSPLRSQVAVTRGYDKVLETSAHQATTRWCYQRCDFSTSRRAFCGTEERQAGEEKAIRCRPKWSYQQANHDRE